MRDDQGTEGFLAADLLKRVRMAAAAARTIATNGLDSCPQYDGVSSTDDEFIMQWLNLLGGTQCERLTDDDLNVTAKWEDLEQLAGMAYAIGEAVGLRQRLEAYEGGIRASV